MGFFDDDNDPFEEIMNEFFGNRGRVRRSSSGDVIRSEKEERVIDYIEEDDKVYFVFELPGFKREDVKVELKGDTLHVDVNRKDNSDMKLYLRDKVVNQMSFTKKVPVKIKKGLKFTFNNGILEVELERK